MAAHDLPPRGSLLVGRAIEADVLLADPSTSAKHARVQVAAGGVTIEDLGSRNGTQVRGQKIPPNQPQVLVPGEAALLGSAVLLVQRRGGVVRRRRLWPHGYFEARLAEECDVAEGGGTPFSIARVDIDPGAGSEAFLANAGTPCARRTSSGSTRPHAFEIILRRATADAAERVIEALVRRLKGARHRRALRAGALPDRRAIGRRAHRAGVRRAAPARAGGRQARRREVVVVDERMREIYRLAEKAAGGDINVLMLGRDRRRQGGARRDRPHGLAARGRAVPLPQLRGAHRDAARERAVRPRARRVHRREDGEAGPARERPAAARCSSTRSARCRRRCRRSCCACSRRSRSLRVGGLKPRADRRALRLRDQPRSRSRRSARSASAPTSTSGSTALARDPAAARAARGDPGRWRDTFLARRDRQSGIERARRSRATTPRRCWRPTPGRATSASCAT